MLRPSWDDYFLSLVDAVGKRATCNRGKSGCVITKDKRIIATGYVGSPSGIAHCDDVGHMIKKVLQDDNKIKEHCVRTIHAEQNAIAQAARYGIALDGGVLYCSMEPCEACAMLIIAVGIKRVVAKNLYKSAHRSRDLFKEAGVKLEVMKQELLDY